MVIDLSYLCLFLAQVYRDLYDFDKVLRTGTYPVQPASIARKP